MSWRTWIARICAVALLAPVALVGCGSDGDGDGDGNNGTENNGDSNNGDTNNGDTNNGDANNGDTNNGGIPGHEIRIEDGMAYIPAGDFWMGCNEALDDRCRDEEKPQHKVTLDAFWMDVYEVTVADYTACVNEGACEAPADTYDSSGGFANYGGPFPNHPINYLTAAQASGYCGWKGGRLPTEAEWEKAARGGCEGWGEDCQTLTPVYPWGNEAPTCDKAFFTQESGDICDGATEGSGPFGTRADVGGRPAGASPYGVQDLAGSISEWTVDFYSEEFYANSPDKNPVAMGDVGDETSDSGLVVRGGAFSDQPRGVDNLRSASRGKQVPYDGIDYLGFRCVRDE